MSTLEDRFRRRLRGDVHLGVTTGRGEDISLTRKARTHHLYSIGRSGFGKSTMLHNLIRQDMLSGAGLAVLSPDDEMFTQHVLPFIPPQRIKDVIYVNPEDTERPVPLNPLHLAPEERDRLHEKVDDSERVFLRLVEGTADVTGAQRMQRILRYTLQTLIEIRDRTLLDFHKLLDRDKEGEGDRYRQWAAARVSDELTRKFWLRDYPDLPRDAHQAVLHRLDKLLTPPMRPMLCAPGACLNFRWAMDTGKILLFRVTSKAIQGEGNANIVGQLIVNKLLLAALSRDDVPESKRPFFPVYIDEFQSFCGADLETYRKMFSRSRKFWTPLHIAHLETGDFSPALVQHILGTVSNFAIFQVSHADAKKISHELVYLARSLDNHGHPQTEMKYLDPKHLAMLPKFHAYAKVPNERKPGHSRIVRIKIDDPPPRGSGSQEIAAEVIRHSRETYGRPVPPPPSPERPVTPAPPVGKAATADIDPGDPFGA